MLYTSHFIHPIAAIAATATAATAALRALFILYYYTVNPYRLYVSLETLVPTASLLKSVKFEWRTAAATEKMKWMDGPM